MNLFGHPCQMMTINTGNKMSKLQHVFLHDIKEGTRFRKEYTNLEELKNAIKEKGVLQPITLDTNMNLQAGGRRLKAARELGLETIPALIRESSDELDLREVELMENVQREDLTWQEKAMLTKKIDDLYREKNGTEWSGRKTAKLLNKAIGGVSMDINLAKALEEVPALGKCKTADDARKLINKAQTKVEVEKAVGEQKKRMKSIPLVQYADNHYRIGDALEEMEKLTAEYKAAGQASNIKLLEVDPPYAIDLHSVKRGNEADEDYNEQGEEQYYEWLVRLAKTTYDLAAPHSFLIFWYGQSWHCGVLDALQKAGWLVDDIPCIWNKGTGQTNQPRYYMARSYETFFLARKGKPCLSQQGLPNVFTYQPMSPSDKWHPTQRPIPLIEALLTTVVGPGAVCCSPFLGSGSTIIAAYKHNIHCFGWDLSKNYKNQFLLQVEKRLKAGEFDVEEG